MPPCGGNPSRSVGEARGAAAGGRSDTPPADTPARGPGVARYGIPCDGRSGDEPVVTAAGGGHLLMKWTIMPYRYSIIERVSVGGRSDPRIPGPRERHQQRTRCSSVQITLGERARFVATDARWGLPHRPNRRHAPERLCLPGMTEVTRVLSATSKVSRAAATPGRSAAPGISTAAASSRPCPPQATSVDQSHLGSRESQSSSRSFPAPCSLLPAARVAVVRAAVVIAAVVVPPVPAGVVTGGAVMVKTGGGTVMGVPDVVATPGLSLRGQGQGHQDGCERQDDRPSQHDGGP